jgi:4-hydroxy-3-polyprenylbenzoate decarboxylase
VEAFFLHVLTRIDLTRDLHFQTRTTIDTLDYSGDSWNSGSKLVIAARGPMKRNLSNELPRDLRLPAFCSDMHLVMPGVLAVSVSAFTNYLAAKEELKALTESLAAYDMSSWPLMILTEDSDWMAAHLNNFLWATFTRSQPAKDVYGVNADVVDKHWQCVAPLIIDARIKPHHAPVLENDPVVSRRVDSMFAKNGALFGKVKGL